MSKKNIITKNTFLISDTHFGDFAFKFNGFKDYLIKKWNQTVSPTDTVLHLGDFTSDSNANEIEIKKYANLLNGYIILVKGNHDVANPLIYEKNGINFLDDIVINEKDSIIEDGIISAASGTFNGLKILFSHYPIRDLYAMANPPKQDSNQEYYYIPENEFEDGIACLDNYFTCNKFDLNIHGHIHEKLSFF